MGWTPVNKITIVRNFHPREIVVTWNDAVVGDKEKRFAFDAEKEVFEFVVREFNSLCM